MARPQDGSGVRRRRSELTPTWAVDDGQRFLRLPREGGDTTAAAEPPGAARAVRRAARHDTRGSKAYPSVARRVLSSVELVVVVVALGLLTALVVGASTAVVVFGIIRAVNS